MDVIVYTLIISFLWGLSTVIHKNVLSRVNPLLVMVIGAYSYIFCMTLLMLYNWKDISKDFKKLSNNDFLVISGTSVFTGFLANIIYYYILKDHSSYIVAALVNSSPVFTFIISYLFIKEKITFYSLFGLIFIIVGILFLSYNESIVSEQFLETR